MLVIGSERLSHCVGGRVRMLESLRWWSGQNTFAIVLVVGSERLCWWLGYDA